MSPKVLPASERRIGPAVLATLFVLAACVGVGVAQYPDLVSFGVWLGPTVFIAHSFPVALIGGLAFIEPLQSLLTSVLPGLARYFDEAVILGLCTIVLIPTLLRSPRKVLRDPLVLLSITFVGWNLLSALINGVSLRIALLGTFVTIDYWLLLQLLRATPIPGRAARALIIVSLCVAMLCLLAAGAQQVLGESVAAPWQFFRHEGGILRVPSLFAHPNDYGYFMLQATFIAVGASLVFKHPLFKVLGVVCVVGVFSSVSRSAWAALFVGLLFGGSLVHPRLRRTALAISLAGGVMMAPLLIEGISTRLAKIQAEGGDARLTYIQKSLPIIRSSPIFGVGPGRFGGEIAHRFGSPIYRDYDVTFTGRWTTVDNFWLHLTVESGIVGSLLVLMMLVTITKRARRLLQAGIEDPWVHTLVAAVPMTTVAYGVICFASMALEANNHAGFFCLLVGTAFSAAGDRLPSENLQTAPSPDPAPSGSLAEC